MEENLTQKAIDSALKCNWALAIKLNLEILKNDLEDIDATNRLARAYFESGNVKKAIATSRKALRIDSTNNIAKNALIRFKQPSSSKIKQVAVEKVSFIEEAGKTKLTNLINLGSEKVYKSLSSGEEVCLSTHAHKVSVVTKNNKYIGKLADDISARIRLFIKEGHKYQVIIKSINDSQVKVFIKGDCLSFPREMSESQSEFSS